MAFALPGLNLNDVPLAIRRLLEGVNALASGRSNAIGSVTLTASATTTDVTDRRSGIDSVIALMPTTSNAAAAIGTTYVSSRGIGTFTLTHANNAQTDRTFSYSIQG